MIEIRQLRHFFAVVDAGGFRAAAKHIHLSPSALTEFPPVMQPLPDPYGELFDDLRLEACAGRDDTTPSPLMQVFGDELKKRVAASSLSET